MRVSAVLVALALAGPAGAQQQYHELKPGKKVALQPPAQPNVLFIYVDDMTVELATYGHPVVQTPNIDLLASRGVRFDAAYCQYPLCNPSRVSVLTGLHPRTTEIYGNNDPFLTPSLHGVPTLPVRFRDAGYQVGGAGKIFHNGYVEPSTWHEYHNLGDTPGIPKPPNPNPAIPWQSIYFGPFENGLDGSLGSMGDTRNTSKALGMMERFPEPWFIAMGFKRPHNPYIYPEMFDSLYDPNVDVPPLPAEEQGNAWKTGVDPGCLWSTNLLGPEWDSDPEQGRREALAAYWRTITYVDDEIGRLLTKLASLGLGHRTVIVLVSDHGTSNGFHGRWGKQSVFEWEMRTPMIVSVPWLTDGTPCARPVQQVDLYPTLMELCHLAPPAGLEGNSLVPLLENPTTPWVPATSLLTKSWDAWWERMVRSDRYKFVWWESGLHQLYDLWADPGEYDNLYGDPAYDAIAAQHEQYLRDAGLLEADWNRYARGLAGTLGVPDFAADQVPLLGTTVSCDLENSSGIPGTMAMIFLGFQGASAMSQFGGTLFVLPSSTYCLPMPSDFLSFPVQVPDDPAFLGFTTVLQGVQEDPGATDGFSFSRPLRLFPWDS